MTFPSNSKRLEREYPDLPENVELQFRQWKVENPLTRVVRISGQPVIVRPAIRRTVSYLDGSAARYLNHGPIPRPDAHPLSGIRGRPEISLPAGLDFVGYPTASPKPGLIEAQNTLLWECVLYPEYDTIRRWPNSVVMACIGIVYQLSGHGSEEQLYNQYINAANDPQADALRTILTVFPSIQPVDPELWTQERFLQVLALSHAHLEALRRQQTRGQDTSLPKVPQKTMGSRQWSSQADLQQSALANVQPVETTNTGKFNWEEDLHKQQAVLG